jgi:hypothetical protein
MTDGPEGQSTGSRKASLWHVEGSPNAGVDMLAPKGLTAMQKKAFDVKVIELVSFITGKWGGGTPLEMGASGYTSTGPSCQRHSWW